MVRKGNREAIAGTGAIALAFTGVLYLITDLVFTTQAAIAVALVFFALTAWRWWAIALYRKAASGQRPWRPRPMRSLRCRGPGVRPSPSDALTRGEIEARRMRAHNWTR
jgi:hypothetical protein